MEPKVIKYPLDYKYFCNEKTRFTEFEKKIVITITTILLFLAKTFLIILLHGKRSVWGEIIGHLWINPYQKQLW